MKKTNSLLLGLALVLITAITLHAQTRLVGARRIVLDNNDLITANNVYLIDNAGSLGIDNTGNFTGTFPNSSSLLTLFAGAKTTNLRIDGGSAWGIDVVNTNNSIRTSGANIFGDGVGNDATTVNISGIGNLTLNGIPSPAFPPALSNLLYLNGSNQVQQTPVGVNITTGNGTANTLPIWTGSGNTLGNSIVTQPTGASVVIGGTNLGINGLNYSWPSVAATPNQVLTNDGAGNLSWATPASTMQFADFFAVMPGDNPATVAPGNPVFFPQTGPSSGGITNFLGFFFIIPTTGTYEISFQVSIDEPGQLGIMQNGILIPSTVVGRATGTSEITGTCMLSLFTGDIIQLVNPPGAVAALTITPLAGGTQPVSAHFVIRQIQ